MENEFLKRGDVDQDLSLFEMESQDDLLISSQVWDIHENVLESPDLSGNDNEYGGLVPFDHQPWCSCKGQVTRRRFKIDGEALMTILQDNDEPRTIDKALSFPNK